MGSSTRCDDFYRLDSSYTRPPLKMHYFPESFKSPHNSWRHFPWQTFEFVIAREAQGEANFVINDSAP